MHFLIITLKIVIYEEKIHDKSIVRSIIERAKQHDTPIITIGEKYEGCISAKFIYDDGFDKIVHHVINHHGCRKLHFMAGVKGNELCIADLYLNRQLTVLFDTHHLFQKMQL